MTALTLRASHALLSSPLAAFGRFFDGVAALIDVFVEAQEQASEAHRKFPFGDW